MSSLTSANCGLLLIKQEVESADLEETSPSPSTCISNKQTMDNSNPDVLEKDSEEENPLESLCPNSDMNPESPSHSDSPDSSDTKEHDPAWALKSIHATPFHPGNHPVLPSYDYLIPIPTPAYPVYPILPHLPIHSRFPPPPPANSPYPITNKHLPPSPLHPLQPFQTLPSSPLHPLHPLSFPLPTPSSLSPPLTPPHTHSPPLRLKVTKEKRHFIASLLNQQQQHPIALERLKAIIKQFKVSTIANPLNAQPEFDWALSQLFQTTEIAIDDTASVSNRDILMLTPPISPLHVLSSSRRLAPVGLPLTAFISSVPLPPCYPPLGPFDVTRRAGSYHPCPPPPPGVPNTLSKGESSS